MAVCSAVGRNIGEAYYHHATLDSLFHEAGAPGDPPEGSCVVKCSSWLKRCSDDPKTDALRVLGDILAGFMDAWPKYRDETYEKRKSEIEGALAKYGLRYHRGRVMGGASSPAAKDLSSIIRSRDIPSLGIEIDRAVASIESDPAAAITAACAIFEAFCNIYIEDEGIEPPTKIGVQSLWKAIRGNIGVSPTPDMDKKLKQILSGLTSILDGVSSLRNSESSAHGRGRVYRVEPRHARLAVNASHALVLFLMEVWEHRKDRDELDDQHVEGQP